MQLKSYACSTGPLIAGSCVALDLPPPAAFASSHHCGSQHSSWEFAKHQGPTLKPFVTIVLVYKDIICLQLAKIAKRALEVEHTLLTIAKPQIGRRKRICLHRECLRQQWPNLGAGEHPQIGLQMTETAE